MEIISTEIIKPSSPTPQKLKTHKLSLLDQTVSPPLYTSVLLFYSPPITTKFSEILKSSLSETLTLYYPLAGKMNQDFSIDCNDEGLLYIEGRVDSSLLDYFKPLNLSLLHKLIPDQRFPKFIKAGDHVGIIQTTMFSCGGVAISVNLSHISFDIASAGAFLKTWSAVATKSIKDSNFPTFIASSLFPSSDSPVPDAFYLPALIYKFDKVRTRRFTFDGSTIAKLKSKVGIENSTRAEVVFSRILKAFMVASNKVKPETHYSVLVNIPVNIRRRISPSLPETGVGNLLLQTTALWDYDEEDEEMSGFISKMRMAIALVNGDVVKGLQGGNGLIKLMDFAQQFSELVKRGISDEIATMGFNSYCNFGLYDIDFGWGKPIWVPVTSFGVKNFVFITDSRNENGVEAWVSLDEDVMALVEQDHELLSIATLDLNPFEQDKA